MGTLRSMCSKCCLGHHHHLFATIRVHCLLIAFSSLNLQVPSLLDGSTGQPLPVTMLYNATRAEEGWRDIAKMKGVRIHSNGFAVGRKRTRRFHTELVSKATKRKICRLLALDYCCLNMQLPDDCKGGEGGDDDVYCAMMEKNETEVGRRIAIKPWRELPISN